MWDALAGVVFPTPCVSCGSLVRPGDPPLCAACWASIRGPLAPLCACGASVPEADAEDARCGRCRRGLSAISAGASLGPYSGALRDCVVALKYQGRHRAAARLALRMVEEARCRSVLSGADCLVPVPLHPARERERGFNQSALLADALGRLGAVPRRPALVRTRRTRSQTDLSARERRLNVRDAFAPARGHEVRGAVVVLVDDVTTTGATIRECATVLRGMGALDVRSITAARAE